MNLPIKRDDMVAILLTDMMSWDKAKAMTADGARDYVEALADKIINLTHLHYMSGQTATGASVLPMLPCGK